MARGWESKSVEAQIEEGNQDAPLPVRPVSTPESRQREQRTESLRLSRSRLLQQLERATHPAHREVLLKGLQAIEHDLEESTGSAPAKS